MREARDSAVDFVRMNVRAGKPIRGAEVDDVSRGVITRAGFGEQFTHCKIGHSIGEETHGNGVNIDNFNTGAIRGVSFPAFVFRSSPESISKEKFGVRSEINYVYVSDKDIEVTGQPNPNGDHRDPQESVNVMTYRCSVPVEPRKLKCRILETHRRRSLFAVSIFRTAAASDLNPGASCAFTAGVEKSGHGVTTSFHRFLRYVQVDTQSDETSNTFPSTPGQLVLLKMLEAGAE